MDDISMQGVFPTLIALMNGGFESGPLEGCDDTMLAACLTFSSRGSPSTITLTGALACG